jgi:restriction system protein
MSKSYRRNNASRKDGIIMIVCVILMILYFLGLPPSSIVGLLAVGLLLAAIVYVVSNPIIDLCNGLITLYKNYKMKKLIQSTSNIDSLSWSEFEHYVADKLKAQGYTNVRLTEHYDLGVDIVAKKDGVIWGVQVKHYSNAVRIEAVREAVAGLKVYGCDRAMVVTNNFFTNPAQELAKSNDCVLIDRQAIAKWN